MESGFKKTDIINIIDSLNRTIILLIEKYDVISSQDIINVLTQCQEAAISIGNYLETLGEQLLVSVKILENFCEDIYQASLLIDNKEEFASSISSLHKPLIKLMKRVKKYLQEDRKSIVFLPYNASMWDSMESVWYEFDKDDSFDTYVMPIPYYEINSDKTFGELKYEGESFPSYVPITSWKEFDLKQERPDIICIHNPYDQYNNITSIHPMFYAKELKKATSLLVYIPYFVGIDDHVDEHFCILPGTIYADKVILQSEKVRRIYLDSFKKFETDNNCHNAFGNVEEKFIALGSPKLDFKISERRRDEAIPSSWMKLIMKEDGGCKKVVLYNTTIDAMLNNKAKMLDKIRSVLEAFKKQPEVILLWRPHPLLRITLQSMLPELLDAYIQIENEYKNAGWGIFDDSSDLHRAVEISDVYYGDGSSIIELFQLADKPVIIQNVDYKGFGTEFTYTFFIGLSAYNNSLYAMQINKNAIVRMDINNGTIHYFDKIQNRAMGYNRMYHFTKVIRDKLYFVPFYDDRIAIYNFLNETYEYHELDLKDEYKSDSTGNFYNMCLHNNKIYLIPFGYRAIVSYDLNTKKTDHCMILSESFPKAIDRILFSNYEFIDDNRIVIPALCSNKVLVFNLENNEFECFHLANDKYCFSSIKKYQDDFYLVVKNDLSVVKWNYNTGKTEEYDKFPTGCKASNKSCFDDKGIHLFDNYLYCFPARSNMAVRVNLDNGQISKIDVFDELCNAEGINKDFSLFNGCAVYKDNIFLHYQLGSIVHYQINIEELHVYPRVLSNSDSEWEKMQNDFWESFLNNDFSNDIKAKTIMNRQDEETAGFKIYQYLNSLIGDN